MRLSPIMVIRWLWFLGQLLDSLYSMCPLDWLCSVLIGFVMFCSM
jgi:hypothetical protein